MKKYRTSNEKYRTSNGKVSYLKWKSIVPQMEKYRT